VIWKMLTVAQTRLRRLDAPRLLPKVLAGVGFLDGIAPTREVAA